MENLHNFTKLPSLSDSSPHSRLFFILSIAAILIGAELMWSQIGRTKEDVDAYSATIFSTVPNRDAFEAMRLKAEVDSMMMEEDLNNEFQSIDHEINAL